MNGRCTGTFVFAHHTPHIERITITGIAVGNQRQISSGTLQADERRITDYHRRVPSALAPWA